MKKKTREPISRSEVVSNYIEVKELSGVEPHKKMWSVCCVKCNDQILNLKKTKKRLQYSNLDDALIYAVDLFFYYYDKLESKPTIIIKESLKGVWVNAKSYT